jgi:hypothetical protein
MASIQYLDPIMISRYNVNPEMFQRHGMDPTLTARSSGGGPSLKGHVVNGNNNLPGILRVRIPTPINCKDNGSINGGKDDSSLETIGIYERESTSNDTAAAAPRRVTWEPKVKDRRGCSVYRWDYVSNMQGIIDKISEMKLLSKLDSGAQELGRGLERLGMKCTGRLAPCANTACARKTRARVVSLIIDTEEDNDLIDLDDHVHTSRMHEETVQNNCSCRDVVRESRDAIKKTFTFNQIGRTKCEWYEDEKPSSHMRLKSLMDNISPSSCASRDKIETGMGGIIDVTPREDPSCVKMHSYLQNRVEPLSILTKRRARHAALATPTFLTTATQPSERPSWGRRHSSHYAITSTTKTRAPIENGKRNSDTKLRRCITRGLKKPIKLMSSGIKRNLKKTLDPKRVLAITTAYPPKHGK